MALKAIEAKPWQRFLKEQDFYKGPIDGLFGGGSKSALRAWARAACVKS